MSTVNSKEIEIEATIARVLSVIEHAVRAYNDAEHAELSTVNSGADALPTSGTAAAIGDAIGRCGAYTKYKNRVSK